MCRNRYMLFTVHVSKKEVKPINRSQDRTVKSRSSRVTVYIKYIKLVRIIEKFFPFSEECQHKMCGFNQRCLVNNRGKARCMCPKYCKNRYMPVCGESNGRHYWNRCYLRKDECRSQQRIGYINGPCKSKSRRFNKTIKGKRFGWEIGGSDALLQQEKKVRKCGR